MSFSQSFLPYIHALPKHIFLCDRYHCYGFFPIAFSSYSDLDGEVSAFLLPPTYLLLAVMYKPKPAAKAQLCFLGKMNADIFLKLFML